MNVKNYNKTFLRILLSSILSLVVVLPSLAWADAAIEPASVYAGDTVTVSGTADPSVWVTIKVLDGEGNIVYLNSIMADEEGNYSDTFIAPDVDPGELQVVAGYGSDVTKNALTVNKKSTSGRSRSSKAINQEIYEQIIPSNFFRDDNKVYKIETPIAKITISDNLFKEQPKEEIKISVEQVSKESLTEGIREQFGDKPVIDINLFVGGQKTEWSNDDVEVEITIPYEPTEEELKNSNKIIAVYIDDAGNLIPITISNYDTKAGGVVLKAKHFSYYGVQYKDKSFNDLDGYIWAKEAIEALSARGVINGITENTFAPEANITRADFVVLVTRFFELEGKVTSNFSDVKSGTYYYEAVGTAKQRGIITGIGKNQFNLKKPISRQDMMVIIKRALEVVGKESLLTAENNKDLSDYDDDIKVAEYAKVSVDYLIQRGVVSGDGENINPAGYTKRAEVAALLYKLLNKL